MPGLADHGLPFKDLADAIQLRNHVLRELEAADAAEPEDQHRHLGFVFVGAGYAGVEALAELSDLVRAALRFFPRLRDAPQRWVLVDAAPKILAEIPPRLGRVRARVSSPREASRSTSRPCSSPWTVARRCSRTALASQHTPSSGRQASRLTRSSRSGGCRWDERGRVRVDDHLRIEGRADMWSLGDCAAVPNAATPGRTDPPTCQHALRQARRLAKNLHGDSQPYAYRMLGQVATLGRYKGIADVLGLRIRGFPGWFVTRTYHLFQLPLVSRKLRVVTDWTTSLFFRRDIAELSILGHAHRLDES